MSEKLFEWLLDGVPGAKQAADVAERIGVDLVESGVPVDRLTVWVTTLHPTIVGRQFRWRPGGPATVADLTIPAQSSAAFQSSPVAVMTREKREIRQRIDDSLAPDKYPILHELRAEGFTDYLCAPLFSPPARCTASPSRHALLAVSRTHTSMRCATSCGRSPASPRSSRSGASRRTCSARTWATTRARAS